MNDTEINNVYNKLKRQQEALEPYMPIRYMAQVLGTKSISTVQEIIRELVETGRAAKVKFGKTIRYKIL